MHLDLYIADDPTNKDAHVSVYSLCHISLRFYAKFVPELLLIHSIIAQITQLTLIWVGGVFPPSPVGFPLITQKWWKL